MKIHHHQAADVKDSDQNIEFIFGENKNYHQIGKAYLQYEMTTENNDANADDRVFVDGDVITLVNNALAYCFKEARLSTTGGSDIEHNKYVDQISTIMRALTSKVGDLLSHFDKNDESQAEKGNSLLKHLLVNNHDVAGNKGKIKCHLPLEHILGFCKTY